MSLLAIDIETFSDVDLPKCGVYAYSDSPLFQILLFAYAFDDEPTQVVDLACGEQLPDRVLAALEDDGIRSKTEERELRKIRAAAERFRGELARVMK